MTTAESGFTIELRQQADYRFAAHFDNPAVPDEQARLRVGRISVDLHLGVPAAGLQQLQRILDQFEEFCVVTQSVRAAIPVDLRVFDVEGVLLKG